MKKLILILLLLPACGGQELLHRVCPVYCDEPVTLTPGEYYGNIFVESVSSNGRDCYSSAVLWVGDQRTERLGIGDEDMGITLVEVRHPDPPLAYSVDLCLTTERKYASQIQAP